MSRVIKQQNDENIHDYYSAEFKLQKPRILYQFKIRKSVNEPMFVVVKEGSKALDNLKEGEVINMRYYSLDKSVPPELRDTRIKYVTKDNSAGFKDHYVIGLDIEFDRSSQLNVA